MNIKRYTISTLPMMGSQPVKKDDFGKWCYYKDVEKLEENLNDLLLIIINTIERLETNESKKSIHDCLCKAVKE